MTQQPELNKKDLRIVGYILVVAILVVACMLMWASRGMGQDGKTKEYKLSEVQLLKLQVQQKDAQLLQAQLQAVQRQFQDKVSSLMSAAEKIKLENGWPPETQFNPDTLTFNEPPPKPKEEKKP
jgi:hypothetical protein